MSDLIFSVLTLAATYFLGTLIIERKHYRSIKERERKFLLMPAVTAKNIIEKNQKIKSVRMVYGSAVISIDYFKRFLGGLRNIFGGELSSFETVLDRARREAILRMKEMAGNAGIIINTRVETSTIGTTSKKGIGCSEVLAYGTALTFEGSNPTNIEKSLNADLSPGDNQPRLSSPLIGENISVRKNPKILEYTSLGLGIAILSLLIYLFLKN